MQMTETVNSQIKSNKILDIRSRGTSRGLAIEKALLSRDERTVMMGRINESDDFVYWNNIIIRLAGGKSISMHCRYSTRKTMTDVSKTKWRDLEKKWIWSVNYMSKM